MATEAFLLRVLQDLESAVVEYDDGDRELVMRDGGQFAATEHEAAIAAQGDHRPVGAAYLGADCSMECVAHRAEGVCEQEFSRLVHIERVARPVTGDRLRSQDAVAR